MEFSCLTVEVFGEVAVTENDTILQNEDSFGVRCTSGRSQDVFVIFPAIDADIPVIPFVRDIWLIQNVGMMCEPLTTRDLAWCCVAVFPAFGGECLMEGVFIMVDVLSLTAAINISQNEVFVCHLVLSYCNWCH